MKTFVLDTNVLLHDHQCLTKFQDNHIVIPVAVLEELNNHKAGHEPKHYAAREVMRQIEDLCDGPVLTGVPCGEGIFSIAIEGPLLDPKVSMNYPEPIPDHRILNTALVLGGILVTKDINLRIKAMAIGVLAQDYQTDKVEPPKNQSLIQDVPHETMEAIKKGEGTFDLSAVENQYFIFRNDSQSMLVKYEEESFMPIDAQKAYGIHPKNAEQTFALDALLDPSIPLVAITGRSGCGKTLLALAAALEMKKSFQQIFVARPIIPLSNRDMGFLPGDIKEKLDPYMQPIFDNLGVIKAQFKATDAKFKAISDMLKEEKIVITPLAYIRGRSLSNIYFIVDEAQNTSPHEIKTIVTRMGSNVKLIFTGDVEQIDQPYLDARSNGLSYLIDKMKGQKLFAHVHLEKGERSALAELASKIL